MCNIVIYLFENRVLRRIFGPKRDEVTGHWRKLHNEKVHDLYSSPTMVRLMKERIMGWATHVTRMGWGEKCTGFWWKNLRERDQWRDLDIDGKIILRRIFRKRDMGLWTGLSWFRLETGGGHL
jgi:hypothetical protein